MDVAVLGIDALDPELVEEWQSELPNLASLIEGGSFGRLRSADPPLTSPAWPTMYTGKQGGKHDVFGFTRRESSSYERTPINYTDVKAESLWEVLDAEGHRCGVMNVPLTFPPADLDNGFVVSGWPVPNRVEISNRPAIVSEIEDATGETYDPNPFPLTYEYDELSADRLFEGIRTGLEHRKRTFEHVLATRGDELDFFFGVFMAIDVASHNFAFEREYLRRMYEAQDEALGMLLDSLDDDVDLILMSDHGHGAKGTWSFHVNEWLREKGYLRLEEGAIDSKSLLQRLGVTHSNYLRVENLLPAGDVHRRIPQSVVEFAQKYIPRGDGNQRAFTPADVDWSETVAYSGEQNELFLNRADTHPQGIVRSSEARGLREELEADLEGVDHPDESRDEPLITHAGTNEELFEGPFVDNAPDIVFVADEMRCNAPMGFSGEVFTSEQWGEHRQYGTLITAGPGLSASGRVADSDIKDVFPLVMSLLDVACPRDVDGALPEPRVEGDGELRFRESRDRAPDARAYDAEETDNVREQLEGLGYLE